MCCVNGCSVWGTMGLCVVLRGLWPGVRPAPSSRGAGTAPSHDIISCSTLLGAAHSGAINPPQALGCAQACRRIRHCLTHTLTTTAAAVKWHDGFLQCKSHFQMLIAYIITSPQQAVWFEVSLMPIAQTARVMCLSFILRGLFKSLIMSNCKSNCKYH